MIWYGGQPTWGWRSSSADQWYGGTIVAAFRSPQARAISVVAQGVVHDQRTADLEATGMISLVTTTREIAGDGYLALPLEVLATALVVGQRRFPVPQGRSLMQGRLFPRVP